MAAPKVLFVMADYGHDPTETAIPFLAFQEAGFGIEFATENGKSPECDKKMLEGLTQKLLGANSSAVSAYKTMKASTQIQSPHSWSSPDFTLDHYSLLFFPGGHEKNVRQVIDSSTVRKHVASYFPKTLKPSDKAVAAICHGVLVVSESTQEDGKSVLHNVETTTLLAAFEKTAYWGTRAFLGDYYKTYGAGSEDVETIVKQHLGDPKLYRSSIGLAPFVVEDENYNYISGRFPADAKLLAEKTIVMVKKAEGPQP